MRKIVPALVAAGLTLLGAAALSVAVVPAAEAQASKAKAPKMNPKVLKPLQAALELTNAGNFAEAEAQLQAANAVPGKTPFEQFQVDELLGFVFIKQKKYNDAAAAYERGLESGLLPPEQVPDRLRLMAQLYLQTEPKDLARSGEFGKRWLEATGTRDPAILGLVGQAAYFSDNFSDAAKYSSEAVAVAKAAGQKPEENWLLILQSSYSKLKNTPGITEATTELVRYYPRKEHWNTLTDALLAQAASKDRQILQVFRLMYQVDAMDDADEFTEAASSATLLGSPGEALQFMEKGYATGVLETSGDKAKSQALLGESRRLAASDEKTLPQFEKEAMAAKAGEADVKLGEAYLSYDQPAKGLEAIQRGIGKGGVKSIDEANLSLGRAYILTKNTAEAVKAFESVKSPEYALLAQLWSIHAGQQQ
jgi:tetratricopeptide (TPR) repeat protein